jgi:hypothetical protein
MPQKKINWFDREQLTLACDGRCDKAWGINHRPKVEFDPNEPDDMAFLADHEVGTAPEDPGTYEGGYGKPSGVPLGDNDGRLMNKWCSRECERSSINEKGEPVVIVSFAERRFNMPWKHGETSR